MANIFIYFIHLCFVKMLPGGINEPELNMISTVKLELEILKLIKKLVIFVTRVNM